MAAHDQIPPGSDASPSEDLLRRLLEGEEPSAQMVDELVAAKVDKRWLEEDQWLEFKAPDWLNPSEHKRYGVGSPKDLGAKLCKYVAGFANSEGGVLIVGVEEPPHNDAGYRTGPWSVRPIPPENRHLVEPDVVFKRLHNLGPDLQPVPVVRLVGYPTETEPNGVVLIIATARAYSLLPCTEQQQTVHYWRLHDATLHAPTFLVEDMVLGRRQRPVVRVVVSPTQIEVEARDRHRVRIQPTFEVFNEGLSWMRRLRIGIVYWGDDRPARSLPDQLLTYIRVPRTLGTRSPSHEQRLAFGADVEMLPPFEQHSITFPEMHLERTHGHVRWRAALYVVAQDQPPEWFQVTVTFSGSEVQLEVMPANRPVADWQRLTERGWQPELEEAG